GLEGRRHTLRVAGRDQVPGHAVHDRIARPTHIRRHDRAPGGHGFEYRVRHPLADRGEHGNVEKVMEAGLARAPAGETDALEYTELAGQGFERRSAFPFADEDQVYVRP